MPRNTKGLKRGGPGRPAGQPNKATVEVKTFSREAIEDPEYVDSLKKRLKAGKAPHMETLLFHYAYGKPKETLELGGPGGGPMVTRVVHTFTEDAADSR